MGKNWRTLTFHTNRSIAKKRSMSGSHSLYRSWSTNACTYVLGKNCGWWRQFIELWRHQYPGTRVKIHYKFDNRGNMGLGAIVIPKDDLWKAARCTKYLFEGLLQLTMSRTYLLGRLRSPFVIMCTSRDSNIIPVSLGYCWNIYCCMICLASFISFYYEVEGLQT